MRIAYHPRVVKHVVRFVLHSLCMNAMCRIQLSAAESCPLFSPLQLWKDFHDAVESM